MLKPLGLRFYNNSGSVAENVGFTGTLHTGWEVGFKPPPYLDDNPLSKMSKHMLDDKDIRVGVSNGGIEISVEIGRMRPGEYVWAGAGSQFWTTETARLIWKGRFMADNLPEPIECELPLQVECEIRAIRRDDVEPRSNPPSTRMFWQ